MPKVFPRSAVARHQGRPASNRGPHRMPDGHITGRHRDGRKLATPRLRRRPSNRGRSSSSPLQSAPRLPPERRVAMAEGFLQAPFMSWISSRQGAGIGSGKLGRISMDMWHLGASVTLGETQGRCPLPPALLGHRVRHSAGCWGGNNFFTANKVQGAWIASRP